jgi:hypothetical protein
MGSDFELSQQDDLENGQPKIPNNQSKHFKDNQEKKEISKSNEDGLLEY